MRRNCTIAVIGFVLATLIGITTGVAKADTHWTLDIAPIYFADLTGDSSAPPPVGTVPIYCSGAGLCAGTPATTHNLRLDYGLTYSFSKKWSFAYAHSNFDFSLGRIVSIAPGTSLLTGSLNDRTDKLSINYAAGHGLGLSFFYSSHQRSNVEATAAWIPGVPGHDIEGCFLNNISCPNGGSNPASINSNSWGLAGTYAFGPHSQYNPPMFSLSGSINYFPRPAAGNCGTPVAQAACGSGGFAPDYYHGSGTVFGYGLTMFPFATTNIAPGFIPFVGYESLPVWFHGENTPEVYNVSDFGFIRVLPHGLTFSATYFKLQGRISQATVPGPDVVRSATMLFKLDYQLHG